MKVRGIIELRDRVRHRNRECYGITVARGERFQIRISKPTYNKPALFTETLLHELMHLWLFILMGMSKAKVSARKQHQIIDKVVPLALNELIRRTK